MNTIPTQEELDHSVFVMNDWSGGQLMNLEIGGYYNTTQLRMMLRQAQIALEYRYDELTDYAIFVAQTICKVAPITLAVDTHRLEP